MEFGKCTYRRRQVHGEVLVSVLHKLGLEVRIVNAEVDVEPLEFVCG